jgi:ATP-dependent DNA ligase
MGASHATGTKVPATSIPAMPAWHWLVEPCLPSPAKAPPSGPDWLHEIKHDGLRILARRDAAGVRLYTRNGNDFTKRFPVVVAAVATLPVRPCLIDGEVTETLASQPRPPRRIPCRLSQEVLRGSQPDNRTCYPLLYLPVVHLAAL